MSSRASGLAIMIALSLLSAAGARGQRASHEPGAAPELRLPLPGEGGGTRDFVRVEGDHFVLAGAPYRFVGANVAVMHGPRHRAALEATLDAVVADGLSVIRVWALGEQPADAPAWARDYAFRLGPEGWVEESFAHLDRVLAAARARGLRVIVVLANRWADYGGAPRYLAWSGREVPLDPAGAPSLLAMPAFFEDLAARAAYRAHVERVVGRTSGVSGVAYRDDPTILSWELINESDAPARNRGALLGWTREMAALVRSLDPHHLVAAGHIGYVSQSQRRTWLEVQRLPEIDYADAHAYPTAYERVTDLGSLEDYVDDHVQLAHHVAGKPFVWGELGFTTRTRMHRGVRRTRWLEHFLARSEEDGVDGALAWIYASATERPAEHGIDVDGAEVARTRDVRRVLGRFARRWRREPAGPGNPRLGPSRGEASIWRTRRTLRGATRAHAPRASEDGLAWSIVPAGFAVADAEGVGRWQDGPIDHVYASGAGAVTYRVTTPHGRGRRGPFRRLVVRVRASSELPGSGQGGTDEDATELRVLLDGAELGRTTAPVDDGLGAWIELAVSDASVLETLARPGAHELRLEVPEGPRANGLCLYGDATGRGSLAEGVGELPGRVQLHLER